MVFVDDEGLEEQFLTEDEDTPNVLDTTANRVTTPVDTIPENQGTQQVQEEELNLQPSRGPREESLVNTIDQFLDETELWRKLRIRRFQMITHQGEVKQGL